jgi:hypothetical protein
MVRKGGLEIKGFETTESWKANAYVLQGGRGDAVRKARSTEILEFREKRENVFHARTYGADPVCEAMGEQETDELSKHL